MNTTDAIHPPTAAMYFVAMVCPDDINQKVLSFKHWMLDQFGCTVALKSPAHITIVPPFWMQVTEETTLIQQLHSFRHNQTIIIELNGFSHFNNKVLFVRVVENAALAQLNSEVESHFTNTFPDIIKKEHRPFHPHVTIANRDLSPAAFVKAWARLSKEDFRFSFTAHAISLLKLTEGKWDEIAVNRLPN